ncbi:DUF1102 domain-containing protein [Halorubrum ejinorense]|uniref:DUF1102 domain-containing protein n=1 Tax=Halorubrum ejinorense TaxID=425309 RepID=A0AAV3SPJ2_9EURY
MSTTRRTLTLTLLLVAAGSLAFATGAAVIDGPADTVADGDLAIERADGPSGRYAYFDSDDEIAIDVSASNPNVRDPSFEGVNIGTTGRIDDVFEITYTADQYARVWIDHPDENVTFVADGTSIEGRSSNVTLAPNETVAVGLRIDARGAAAGTALGGDDFDIRAEIAEPEDAGTTALNSDDADDAEDGGATTTVRALAADTREFDAGGLSPGQAVTFDAGRMELAGGNVTLDRVRIADTPGGDVGFRTVGRPGPFASAGPLADSRGAAPNGYFEFNHTFTAEEVSGVRFSVSVDREYLNDTGGDPEDLALFRRSESEPDGWERLETERVDPSVRQFLDLPEDRVHVEATTDDFSVFAVATERPVVRATGASLDRTAVAPGESVVVRATVANEGGADGSREVTVTADGDPVATRLVDLDPDESTALAFEPAFDDPGTYEVAVGDAAAGTLVVGDPGGDESDGDGAASAGGGSDAGDAGSNDASDAADSPTEEPSGIDPSNLGGLAAFLVIVLVSVALVRRMPRS